MAYILSIAFIIGALFGWRKATKLGGNRLDKLQYGAAHGIAVMLLALVVTLLAVATGILQ